MALGPGMWAQFASPPSAPLSKWQPEVGWVRDYSMTGVIQCVVLLVCCAADYYFGEQVNNLCWIQCGHALEHIGGGSAD